MAPVTAGHTEIARAADRHLADGAGEHVSTAGVTPYHVLVREGEGGNVR